MRRWFASHPGVVDIAARFLVLWRPVEMAECLIKGYGGGMAD
jgi:hypothetical protein